MNVAVAPTSVDAALRARLGALIRSIPDFPNPGVLFKDITPLLADGSAFGDSVDALVAPWRGSAITAVCGVEARGFIFGAAAAHALGVGFVPVRKAGKLPAATRGVDFKLEYGTARLEAHADALTPGTRALLVDDVLATGGTLTAALQLVRDLGANVAGAAVVVELGALNARARWPADVPLHALLLC